MKTTKEKTKQQALAEFLKTDEGELQEGYNENNFEFGREEYLVLTDEEADEATKDYIKESVWAFNKSFLDCHSEAISEMDEEIFKAIQDKCGSANKTIMRLIDDFDHFVEDAISADGRGHFLSGYDGEENEQGEYFIYRTN